jgi:NifU-like protein involved in Fe-S cluster formation
MMRGGILFGRKELGDLKSLEGALEFPVRVKCATLAWYTTQKGIDEQAAKKR